MFSKILLDNVKLPCHCSFSLPLVFATFWREKCISWSSHPKVDVSKSGSQSLYNMITHLFSTSETMSEVLCTVLGSPVQDWHWSSYTGGLPMCLDEHVIHRESERTDSFQSEKDKARGRPDWCLTLEETVKRDEGSLGTKVYSKRTRGSRQKL